MSNTAIALFGVVCFALGWGVTLLHLRHLDRRDRAHCAALLPHVLQDGTEIAYTCYLRANHTGHHRGRYGIYGASWARDYHPANP